MLQCSCGNLDDHAHHINNGEVLVTDAVRGFDPASPQPIERVLREPCTEGTRLLAAKAATPSNGRSVEDPTQSTSELYADEGAHTPSDLRKRKFTR